MSKNKLTTDQIKQVKQFQRNKARDHFNYRVDIKKILSFTHGNRITTKTFTTQRII